MEIDGDGASAARRRSERRMRWWFRHEQQSIRMALVTASHHSFDKIHAEYGAPRSQSTATRASGGGENHEKKYTAKFRKTPPPQPELFQLYEEVLGGVRPGPVLDPRPQERVQRHTVEHIVDLAPTVQIVDALQAFGHRGAPRRLSTCPRSHKAVSRSAWWTAIFVIR